MNVKICKYCQKEFEKGRRTNATWRKAQFCGTKCSARFNNPHNEGKIAEYERMLKSGMTATQIAKHFGVTHQAASKYVRDHFTITMNIERKM